MTKPPETFTVQDLPLVLFGQAKIELFRGHRGYYPELPDEVFTVKNLVPNVGRTYIAKRMAGGDAVASVMAYMALGSGTTAPALTDGSTPGLYGEIKRKATAVYSAITNNVVTMVATFGGAAETIQSIAITEAGGFNHASSGQGTAAFRVTWAGNTLADSDLLKITHESNIGSSTI